jgi:hypothetical protein
MSAPTVALALMVASDERCAAARCAASGISPAWYARRRRELATQRGAALNPALRREYIAHRYVSRREQPRP